MQDPAPVPDSPAGVAPTDLPAVGTADPDLIAGISRSTLFSRLESMLSVVSPLTSSPGAPLETTSFIRSLQPSLMPRTSLHQGAVSGLSILAARGVSTNVERLTARATFGSESLAIRLAARAGIAAGGRALRSWPEDDDHAWPADVSRLTGELLEVGAFGGMLYDVLSKVRSSGESTDERGLLRLGITTAVSLGAAAFASRHFLAERRSYFTDDFDQLPLTLPRSLVNTAAVTALGTGIGVSFRATRRGWRRYFGPGITKEVLARTVNAGLWAGGVTGLYWAGISYVGRANEKVDPGYATPPTSPLVSGSPESLSAFDELGQQGRRYVLDALRPELIRSTMGEDGVHPIRIFVGFNDHPIHTSSRSETALAEMERTGAYDRKYVLLVSPTGTGWVDHTMLESAEFLTRGDIASVCIQYGRYPSFLSLQKVRQGRRQFRSLVQGVHQRLMGMPEDRRPTVLVFGESLGAWSSSDVVMKSGVEGFDQYSIHRALCFGMPHLAKWSAAGLDRPGSMTPPGTVGVFDRWEELSELTPEERDRLRVVQLSHDNDPITHVDPSILYRTPDWLGEPRGRGVPDGQRWYPVVTFLQTLIDAANAMRNSPGEFRSTGHDYRADTARFVAEGYRLPYTEDQLAAVEVELRRLEKERAERIKPPKDDAAAPPAPQAGPGGNGSTPTATATEPRLTSGRTAGPGWLRKSGLGG